MKMEIANKIVENWEYILLALYIAEKVVLATPCKWDDIVLEVIKKSLAAIFETFKGKNKDAK